MERLRKALDAKDLSSAGRYYRQLEGVCVCLSVCVCVCVLTLVSVYIFH